MKYKTIPSETNLYFVTSRLTNYLSIFVNDDVALIPLNSLNWFTEKRIWKLYAFCLMPNHLHILVELLDSRPVEKIMGQFHSFTGHEIVNYLKANGRKGILYKLAKGGEKKGDRDFLVWEDALAKCVGAVRIGIWSMIRRIIVIPQPAFMNAARIR